MVINPASLTRRDIVKWIKLNLSRYGIRLRRRLSQILLVDPHAYRVILDTIEKITDRQTSVLVEIGAGLGTLTSALATIDGAYIIALEIDKKFTPVLRELQEELYNVDIVIGDATALIKSIRSLHVVVGNLPYHITSDLILAISATNAPFSVITIQKDVADRLTAEPGSKNYGKISILVQYLFDIEIIRILPPNSFLPKPEVFSSIVMLRRVRSYSEYAPLEQLVKCLFSYKRKHVLKSLVLCLNLEEDIVKKISPDDELWKKRVNQLASRDLEKLVTLLQTLNLEQRSSTGSSSRASRGYTCHHTIAGYS